MIITKNSNFQSNGWNLIFFFFWILNEIFCSRFFVFFLLRPIFIEELAKIDIFNSKGVAVYIYTQSHLYC